MTREAEVLMGLECAMDMIHDFHDKHGIWPCHDTEGHTHDHKTMLLRSHLINEELAELMLACYDNDRVKQADAMADLLYVVLGTAVVLDLPLPQLFLEVHRSNMTKNPSGDPRVRVKGEGYVSPDIERVLKESGE